MKKYLLALLLLATPCMAQKILVSDDGTNLYWGAAVSDVTLTNTTDNAGVVSGSGATWGVGTNVTAGVLTNVVNNGTSGTTGVVSVANGTATITFPKSLPTDVIAAGSSLNLPANTYTNLFITTRVSGIGNSNIWDIANNYLIPASDLPVHISGSIHMSTTGLTTPNEGRVAITTNDAVYRILAVASIGRASANFQIPFSWSGVLPGSTTNRFVALAGATSGTGSSISDGTGSFQSRITIQVAP